MRAWVPPCQALDSVRQGNWPAGGSALSSLADRMRQRSAPRSLDPPTELRPLGSRSLGLTRDFGCACPAADVCTACPWALCWGGVRGARAGVGSPEAALNRNRAGCASHRRCPRPSLSPNTTSLLEMTGKYVARRKPPTLISPLSGGRLPAGSCQRVGLIICRSRAGGERCRIGRSARRSTIRQPQPGQ